MRLNPDPRPGAEMRGWYVPPTCRHRLACSGDMSRGQFIRTYGRRVWDALEPIDISKDGRRMYVRRSVLVDFGDQFLAIATGAQTEIRRGPIRGVLLRRGTRTRPSLIAWRREAA